MEELFSAYSCLHSWVVNERNYEKAKILIYRPGQGGFGNRMRSLISAFMFSIASGRILFVDYLFPIEFKYLLDDPGWRWDLNTIANFPKEWKSFVNLNVTDLETEDTIRMKNEDFADFYKQTHTVFYEGHLDRIDLIFNNPFFKQKFEKLFESSEKARIFMYRRLVNPSAK